MRRRELCSSFMPKVADGLANRIVGEFVIRNPIGSGEFGTVYRADQPSLNRELVVKVLRDHHRYDPSAVTRFMREAQLASQLDHPYAAHVYACGAEPDGVLWIAMELVRGVTMAQLLATHGPVARERLVTFVDQLCEVVDAAHALGIVHRDIKPANVMVVQRGGRWWPKLLDFGVARGPRDRAATTDPDGEATFEFTLVDDSSSPWVTIDGAPIGSPAYMAPELWTRPASADGRADIYALGILIYEALTGAVPFREPNVRALYERHAKSALPTTSDPTIDLVLARATAKQAAARYGTARELAAGFRDACGISARERPAGIDDALRDALLSDAPRPLAEAVAVLDEAVSGYQMLSAIALVSSVAVRWVALIALAARMDGGGIAADELALLEEVQHEETSWLELASMLVEPYRRRAWQHALPELVELLDPAGEWFQCAAALVRARQADIAANAPESVASLAVARRIPELATMLRGLSRLSHYRLVVPSDVGAPWDWTGARRRALRCDVALRLTEPALLDGFGRVVVRLGHVARVTPPSAGVDDELFLFEGHGRRGARLIAWPSRFEHHDEELWCRLGGASEHLAPAAMTPYPGLRPFTVSDAGRFVGRERDAEAFRNRLQIEQLLVVVGPSGSGKSSFVQAGIIGELGDEWSPLVVRPGPDPVGVYAELIAPALAATDSPRVIIVVDQAEELFTQCRDEAARVAFARSMVECAGGRVHVVLTLRDDFLIRTAGLFGNLERVLHFLVTPSTDDLRRILVEPARAAGFEFESDALVDEVVDSVVGVDGGLALLAFAAARLWERRDIASRALTTASYRALGGVGGALAKHADATLAALSPQQRAIAQRAFCRLVTIESSRAAFGRDELIETLGNSSDAAVVLEQLVAARLLVVADAPTGPRVEIVHEILIRAWPQLAVWRAQDVETTQMLDQLRNAARHWLMRGRDHGLLWRGDAWLRLEQWRARQQAVVLSSGETEFVRACEREAVSRRRYIRAAAVAGLLATVGVVVALSWSQMRATRAATETRSQLIAATRDAGRRLLLDGDPAAALSRLDAARAGPDPTLQFMLSRAADRLSRELAVLQGGKRVASIALGANLIVAGTDAGTALVWDDHDKLVRTFHAASAIGSVAVSRDGATVLSAGDATRLWNAQTGALIWQDSVLASIVSFVDEDRAIATVGNSVLRIRNLATGGEHSIGSLLDEMFVSPDHRLVAVKQARPEGIAIVVVDAATGLETGRAQTTESALNLHGVALSHDDRQLAYGLPDGTVVVVRLGLERTAPTRIAAHSTLVTSLAFSPDDTRLLTTSNDRQARMWQLDSGELEFSVLAPQPIAKGMFSPDGSKLLTFGGDGDARLWDAHDGTPLLVLAGHTAPIEAAVFSADGGRVVTGGWDGTVRVWDVGKSPVAYALTLGAHRFSPSDRVWYGRLAPDERMLVTVTASGHVLTWDMATGAAIREVAHIPHEIYSVAFSPDGERIAIGSADHRGHVYRVRDGVELVTLTGHAERVWKIEFSPDGNRLLTASWDHTAAVWDAHTGTRLAVLAGHRDIVWDAAWSPDGRSLATASDDGTAIVWNAMTFQERIRLTGHTAGIGAVAFAPDSRRVVTGSRDLTARVWDAVSGVELAVMRGQPSAINALTFSPDGNFLFTSGLEGGAHVWDAATGDLLASIDAHHSAINALQVTRDGQYLLTVSSFDDRAKMWRLDLLAPAPTHADVLRLLACSQRACEPSPTRASKR